MKYQQIIKLMDHFEKSKLTRLKITMEKTAIELEKTGHSEEDLIDINQAQIIKQVNKEKNEIEKKEYIIEKSFYIKAPMVGTFYRAPSPDEEPYVKVGSTSKKGETIGLIESMKMINELHSPYDCIIEEILIENDTLASYDSAIFRVRKIENV